MISLGLDLSATSTGLVVLCDSQQTPARPQLLHEEAVRVKTKGMQRASDIAERVIWAVEHFHPDRVVVEGYAVGKYAGSVIVTIEIGGIVRYFLCQLGVQFLEPTPTQLKKFVLGGQGEKSKMMMSVLKRWGHEAQCDDTADGYGLACIGLAHGGKLKGLTQAMLEVIGTLRLK